MWVQGPQGVELVVVRVKANRYMYHQIRNMMGLAMLVLQSGVEDPTGYFNQAFNGTSSPGGQPHQVLTLKPSRPLAGSSPLSFTIPLAPAEPLLLSSFDCQVCLLPCRSARPRGARAKSAGFWAGKKPGGAARRARSGCVRSSRAQQIKLSASRPKRYSA